MKPTLNEYFNQFLKEYVSEEYDVKQELSLLLYLLRYQRLKRVSLDEAFEDLTSWSTPKIICYLCCLAGSSLEVKIQVSKNHNLIVAI